MIAPVIVQQPEILYIIEVVEHLFGRLAIARDTAFHRIIGTDAVHGAEFDACAAFCAQAGVSGHHLAFQALRPRSSWVY